MAKTPKPQNDRDADDAGEAPVRFRFLRAAWTYTAAGVLAIIVVMFLFLLVKGDQTDEPQAAAPVPAAAPAPARSSGECEATTPNADPPAEAPASKWDLVGTMAAPSDPNNGPKKVTKSGYRVCFAHTAVGALYAAVAFLATETSDKRGVEAIKQYVADTPERQYLLDSPDVNERLDAERKLQVRGFRFAQTSEDRMVVELAMGVEGLDQYMQLILPMRWENDDWKIVAPASGNITGDALADLSGYTPWSGA